MKNNVRQNSAGFTVIELIVAILLTSVLAAIAIPSYLHYIKKAYYSEIVQTADRYSMAVAVCLRKYHGKKTECNAGENGVPPNINSGVGQVKSISVINAVITVTPKTINGISEEETYILTPTYSKHGVLWKPSGGGCERHMAPDC